METPFLRFVPGTSPWHRHNPCFKLGEMIFWCSFALTGQLEILLATGLTLFVIHCIVGTRLKQLKKPLKFWMFLSLVTVFFSSLAQQEPALVLFGISTPFGITGIKAGVLRISRLLTVLMACQILVSTTDPVDVAHSVRILTFFLPKKWSGTVAAAINLTFTFIPRLFTEAEQVREAMVSRGLQSRRSLFLRFLLFGLSLTWRTVQMIDMVADALLSRRFVTDPTTSQLAITWRDCVLGLISTVPPLAVWFILY